MAPQLASGAPEPGPASKAVRKGAVCELTGTMEGKRSRDEGWGDIGCFIAVKRRGTPCPIWRSVPACSLGDLCTGKSSSLGSRFTGIAF